MQKHEIKWAAIPPITDPLGACWNQPKREDILLDETPVALMSKKTFDGLATYDVTIPTGTYAGKMWKRSREVYDKNRAGGLVKETWWFLCWYEDHPTEKDKCMIKNARIYLIDHKQAGLF